MASGLSSGEGVIYEVRDPRFERVTDKHGNVEEKCVDPGVTDKRLLLFEGRDRQGPPQHGAARQHALGRAPRCLGPRQSAHPDQEQPQPRQQCAHQPDRSRHR